MLLKLYFILVIIRIIILCLTLYKPWCKNVVTISVNIVYIYKIQLNIRKK